MLSSLATSAFPGGGFGAGVGAGATRTVITRTVTATTVTATMATDTMATDTMATDTMAPATDMSAPALITVSTAAAANQGSLSCSTDSLGLAIIMALLTESWGRRLGRQFELTSASTEM